MNAVIEQVSLKQLEEVFNGLMVFDENRQAAYVSKALQRRGVLPSLFKAQYARSESHRKTSQGTLLNPEKESYPIFFKAKDATFPHLMGKLIEYEDGQVVFLGHMMEDASVRSLLPFASSKPSIEEYDIYLSHILPTLGDLLKLTNRFIEQDQKTRVLNREMDALVAHLPGGILLEDSKGIIHKANPSLVYGFGFDYPNTRLLGKRTEVLMRVAMRKVKDPKSFLDHIEWARLTDQDLYKIETEMVDGRVLQWDSILIYQGGEAAARLWYFQDVSDWRHDQAQLKEALENAQRANEDREAFLSLLGREYRNPLNVIQGVNQFLKEMPLNRAQQDYVQIIENASQAMLTILNDLDSFNQLREGKVELLPSKVDLEQLLENLIMANFADGGKEGLDYILHMDPDLPEEVEADSERLTQLIHHLLQNAKRFTITGYILIKVTCPMKTDTIARLVFEVIDTGKGLSKEREARVKAALKSDKKTFYDRHEGLGLGLPICKSLVALMDGNISFTTEEGVGTNFRVEMSMKVTKPAVTPIIEEGIWEGFIAVVTSNPLLSDAIADSLHCLGMRVEVKKPEEMLEDLTMQEPPQVLILDELAALTLRNGIPSTHPSYASFRTVSKLLLYHNPSVLEDAWFKDLKINHVLLMPATPMRLRYIVSRCLHPLEGEDQVEEGFAEESPVEKSWQFKVLVVEDQFTDQLVLKTLLEGLSCKVDVADAGEEGLKLASRSVYDIIFMDIYLPGIDGVETTRRLRRIEDGGRNTPVVAMTSDSTEDRRTACNEVGMNGFLTKPVSKEKLQKTLDKWCNYFAEIQERDIDFEGLALTIGGDLSMLGRMVDVFDDGIPVQMTLLQKGIKAQEEEAVLVPLRMIRSSLSFLHATKGSKLLRRLEKAVMQQDWNTVEMAFMALEKALFELKGQLQEKLAS